MALPSAGALKRATLVLLFAALIWGSLIPVLGNLAGRYDIQKELAVSLITFTTVLSAATAPIWMAVILNAVK